MRHETWMAREPPPWLSGLLIFASLSALLWLEKRRPLRRQRQSKVTRDARNLAVAALSATAIRVTEKPLAAWLTGLVERRRWGLVKLLRLPPWIELPLAIALLDYTLFVWHVLTHKLPWLWRFHRVHHVDLDMDVTTAIRFHFAEMILSVPWRAGQILVIGASPLAFSIWQTVTLMEILFHHSNVELPLSVERRLCRLIVTPRMHGIHHSIVKRETDSNWSTIFTFPDYLHGTLRLDVPQDAITIGVAGYQEPSKVTFGKIMKMPVTG